MAKPQTNAMAPSRVIRPRARFVNMMVDPCLRGKGATATHELTSHRPRCHPAWAQDGSEEHGSLCGALLSVPEPLFEPTGPTKINSPGAELAAGAGSRRQWLLPVWDEG